MSAAGHADAGNVTQDDDTQADDDYDDGLDDGHQTYPITESTVDAELFALEVEDAIASRFLRPGDVLVMDNAANHTGKENTVLEDWLWEEHSIFALFLPARTPEWNPIELVWNCLTQRLKHYDWDHLSASYRVVHAAIYVLDRITHEEVERFYEKSGVFTLHGHA
jgi:transposase